MREVECDVAVIGAGSAGIAAFRAASEAGVRAVLIERGPGGTTCARVGCMPSKLLVAAADAAHAARGAGLFGVRVPAVEVDGPAVLARLRRERDRFVAAVFDGLDDIPAEQRIGGSARFTDGNALVVDDHTRVRFRAAVVAAGSSPSVPKPLRDLGDRVLTTDTLFEIADLPGSLAVLGGGPVGVEIAQAMARLGVAVSLFDVSGALAGLSEPGLVAEAADLFGREITLHLNGEVTGGTREGDGVRLHWKDEDGAEASGAFDRVLAAAGRPPNVAGLDLAAAGLRLDDKGMPAFDPRSLLCAEGPILIAGDASAVRPVLHEASRQGRIAGRNAARIAQGEAAEAPDPWVALAMVFTQPQAATVGAPYDADDRSRVVGRTSFSDQGRARVDGVNAGGIALWADREGRLLGAEMLGPQVEHLAHIVAYAIQDRCRVHDLVDRPVYHPTVEEGLSSALYEIIQELENDRS
ncbi:dihydrolipoyl dehydrogenase [Methylobacterium sp. A54F]